MVQSAWFDHRVPGSGFAPCALHHGPRTAYNGAMEDDRPRSAVEIAMARLKQRDADSGVADRTTTDEQKAAIAEARNVHAAKVAEVQILQRSKLSAVFDPADRERVEAEYRDELRRLGDDLERKIAKIRAV